MDVNEKADYQKTPAGEYGWTALMGAAQNGHTGTMLILLKAGANVDVHNRAGVTALMLAAQNGHAGNIKVLMDAGADAKVSDKEGWTALMLSANNGHTSAMNVLLFYESAAKTQISEDVSVENIYDAIGRLLESLEDMLELMDFPSGNRQKRMRYANMQNKDGQTALMLAAKNGHTEAVRALIGAGADVNLQDNNKITALMLSEERGYNDIAKLYHKAKADKSNPELVAAVEALLSKHPATELEALKK